MEKNNAIHLEEAMSPRTILFVENNELEKRCVATSSKETAKNAAKKQQDIVESGHSIDSTVVHHGKSTSSVRLPMMLLISAASTF